MILGDTHLRKPPYDSSTSGVSMRVAHECQISQPTEHMELLTRAHHISSAIFLCFNLHEVANQSIPQLTW